MPIGRSMASLACNCLRCKGRLFVAVQGECHRTRRARMAEQALGGDGTVKIEFPLDVKPRREIPLSSRGIPGSGRLKQPPLKLYQVASTMIARTDEIANPVNRIQAVLLQPVLHSCRIAGYFDSAA